jgi:ferrous iron transport protein B
MVAPLMSCSARLPVYVLLIGAFIPATPLLGGMVNLQAATLLGMYCAGAAVAIPVAWILKRTVLKGPTQSFLMELPTYKWPSPQVVFHRVAQQAREFCVSAGTIIFAVAIVIWALGYYPHPASIAADYAQLRTAAEEAHAARLADVAAQASGQAAAVRAADQDRHAALAKIDRDEAGAYLRQSFLGRMGHWIEPVVRPLGWDWRIGTAAIASFPAREVVVATIGTIYNLGGDQDENSAGLRDKLRAATWPDGRAVFNVPVALSIMVFFALCCQCGATLAVIKRETKSWRWPVFTFTYMTALAYVAALVVYQVTSRLV